MKKFFTLFAFISLSLIFAQYLDAQRADKNKLRATFTQYPYQPLPDSVKTYSAKINPGDISPATPLIHESIGIWEKALDQSNPSDKKARINEDITAGLQHNIALAYAWLRDFSKSREWVAKAVKVKDGQKLMQNVQGWIDDHEKRLAANGLL